MLEIIIAFWPIWLIFLLFVLFVLLRPKLFGYMGESVVRYKLSKLDPNKYKVINNFLAVVDGKSTEIDHIVVSNYGVYVIETKYYKGLITGHEKSKHWTQHINRYKNKFHNPIRQNYGHVMALKTIFKKYPRIPFIPIVVFTGEAKIRVKTDSAIVIESKDLLQTIKNYNKPILKDKGVHFVYDKLASMKSNDKELRKEHIAKIREKKKFNR